MENGKRLEMVEAVIRFALMHPDEFQELLAELPFSWLHEND